MLVALPFQPEVLVAREEAHHYLFEGGESFLCSRAFLAQRRLRAHPGAELGQPQFSTRETFPKRSSDSSRRETPSRSLFRWHGSIGGKQDGERPTTGLATRHPYRRFADEP